MIDSLLLRGEQNAWTAILHAETTTGDVPKQKLLLKNKKTFLLESLFNKVAGIQSYYFIKKRLQHRCFPVKFAKFLKNTYFEENVRTTLSFHDSAYIWTTGILRKAILVYIIENLYYLQTYIFAKLNISLALLLKDFCSSWELYYFEIFLKNKLALK